MVNQLLKFHWVVAAQPRSTYPKQVRADRHNSHRLFIGDGLLQRKCTTGYKSGFYQSSHSRLIVASKSSILELLVLCVVHLCQLRKKSPCPVERHLHNSASTRCELSLPRLSRVRTLDTLELPWGVLRWHMSSFLR